jgi:N-acetyl-anhydromuramyl-L-alanine amidase AmpD
MNGISFIPTKNYFPNTGKKSFLVLHATAGGNSAQAIANYFISTEGTNNPVSSHYIVGQDGHIIQMVDEKDGAFANGVVNSPNWQGNPNIYTISIEFVKSSTDNSDPLTEVQKQSGFSLIEDICNRNGIGKYPADMNTGIVGHFAIDPVNRARCPGNFPWQELWSYLINGGKKPVQTPSTNQLKAMNDCWDSVLKNMVQGPAPKNTSIFNDWCHNYINGEYYGPPLCHEYQSVDWNGNLIFVQEFARGRAEFSNGKVSWYV